MDYPTFNARFAVSRETFDRLSSYHDLLFMWQSKLNLISPKTANEIWERHILDSCQFASYLVSRETSIMDIGTGAGLPGIILAILGFHNITLVDSDHKKCAFLREVAAQLNVKPSIICERIELLSHQPVSIVTSRALASLDQLFAWSSPLLSSSGKCLFAKGENYATEIDEALKQWDFDVILHPSITRLDAVILEISRLTRKAIL